MRLEYALQSAGLLPLAFDMDSHPKPSALLREEALQSISATLRTSIDKNIIFDWLSGLGKIQHREFVMGSGEMDRAHFQAFIRASLTNQARFSRHGALICIGPTGAWQAT